MRDDIHIVLDSLSCVAETELKNDPRVHELRLLTRHGDLEWFDGEKSTAEMVKLIAESGKLPTTSQPPLGEIVDLYTKLVTEGKKIIVLNVDGILSGTHETCKMAARQVMRELKGADIRVYDSYTASCPLVGTAMDLLQLIDEGVTMDEACAWLEDAIGRLSSYFTVDTLEYLQKGGRIGKMAGLLGSIFGIRPLTHLGEDTKGQLIPVDKVRTRKKALARIMELAVQDAPFERIYIANCECENDAAMVESALKQQFPGVPLLSTSVGTVLAAHLGPGAFGIFVRKAK
ncbi:MAG: DegV family protein [Acidaminococcaceae bacterium]|nr:DegV family protein [Acidaminococcaceae bacterium]